MDSIKTKPKEKYILFRSNFLEVNKVWYREKEPENHQTQVEFSRNYWVNRDCGTPRDLTNKRLEDLSFFKNFVPFDHQKYVSSAY